MDPKRAQARQLAREHIAAGRFSDWYEALYARAGGDPGIIPWADMQPNPNLTTWLENTGTDGRGRRALVIGCGLGDDAELLSARGFEVTAFDISPTAVAWAQRRFPRSSVEYLRADLLAAPPGWRGHFEFILESYTLQSFLPSQQHRAIAAIPPLLASGGLLLVICRGADAPCADENGPPWPVARGQLEKLASLGLTLISFEDYIESEDPPVRRFRTVHHREV